MEEKAENVIIAIVAIDPTNDFSYLVCSLCEKPLPLPNANAFSLLSSKRLFRLLMSIASDTKVLIGCSADEFFNFAKLHPFSATNAGKVLEGQLFQMALSKPKNGNAGTSTSCFHHSSELWLKASD